MDPLLNTLPSLSIPLLIGFGSISVLAASLALGIRHGIDWDHIAAITDITSTTAAAHPEHDDEWLVREPGVQLTDESHHDHDHLNPSELAHHAATSRVSELAERYEPVPISMSVASATAGSFGGVLTQGVAAPRMARVSAFARRQRPSLLLGTMYALGHGSVVFALGVLALVANEFLPDWIDPIMERVVGVTLLFLSIYLFYSLYRYFRGGGEFRIRSRWMLVFAGVRNAWEAGRERVFGIPKKHHHEAQQYGVKTAFGIGMIHGVGAETGTQVLVITTAAGAGSTVMGVVALSFFIIGLLISNSIVVLMTTVGFVSSRQKNTFYVVAGLFAAIFSLVVGLVFLTRSVDILPDLDQYFRWIGGGKLD